MNTAVATRLPPDVVAAAAAAHIARAVRNKGRKADLKQRSGSHG
jgi:hypothetical protein